MVDFRSHKQKWFCKKSDYKLCSSTSLSTLQTGESLNLRKITSKSVLHEQCLKVPGTATIKTRFPKLDYKSSASYNNSYE